MIKVSVIIATYRSGEGLDRVVQSLDAQTLSQDEFETIFIDDGSPDDTYARLERIHDARDNVVIDRIENSGWPSRPRNLALERARGEYVVFMDHDDELSPDALRAAYELGHANGADAVNAKESRTKLAGWSLDVFNRNMDNAIGRVHPTALAPMNPHKMYRREFLLEHSIRFPEGRRVLWEDIHFNIGVLKHATVISLLSDTAFYHWVSTGENNSSSYGRDVEEFWTSLVFLLETITHELAGEEHREIREALLAHNYKTRVLSVFSPGFPNRPDAEVERIRAHMRRVCDDLVPEELDARLSVADRAKSMLLRADRFDLLRDLSQTDRHAVGLSRASRVRWEGGRLVIDARASWSGGQNGTGLDLVSSDGDRVVRAVSSRVAASLPRELLDVTDTVGSATADLAIRDTTDLSVWMLPTENSPRLVVDAQDRACISAVTETSVDIRSAVFGRPLHRGRWSFTARVAALWTYNQRAVRYDGPPRIAFIDGQVAIAYKNGEGLLNLDIGQTVRSVAGSATPDLAHAKVMRERTGVRFSIPLTGVHVVGTTVLEGHAAVRPGWGRIGSSLRAGRLSRLPLSSLAQRTICSSPARIIADEAGARFEGALPRLPMGTYDLVFTFEGRTVVSAIRLRVARGGVEATAR